MANHRREKYLKILKLIGQLFIPSGPTTVTSVLLVKLILLPGVIMLLEDPWLTRFVPFVLSLCLVRLNCGFIFYFVFIAFYVILRAFEVHILLSLIIGLTVIGGKYWLEHLESTAPTRIILLVGALGGPLILICHVFVNIPAQINPDIFLLVEDVKFTIYKLSDFKKILFCSFAYSIPFIVLAYVVVSLLTMILLIQLHRMQAVDLYASALVYITWLGLIFLSLNLVILYWVIPALDSQDPIVMSLYEAALGTQENYTGLVYDNCDKLFENELDGNITDKYFTCLEDVLEQFVPHTFKIWKLFEQALLTLTVLFGINTLLIRLYASAQVHAFKMMDIRTIAPYGIRIFDSVSDDNVKEESSHDEDDVQKYIPQLSFKSD